MRCLSQTKERDHDGETDRDFGCRYGDDEENKNLRVVIGRAAWIDMETGEGDERQVCRVQHQLERHQDDDDVAPHHHAGETDREKNSADYEIMAERDHVNGSRAGSASPRRSSRSE